MKAYMLVQTDPTTTSIAPDLQTVQGIVFAQDLEGPYDAIALARSESSSRTLSQIIEEIRALPGVTRALTAMVRSSLKGSAFEAA